jgi:hypothetical protein
LVKSENEAFHSIFSSLSLKSKYSPHHPLSDILTSWASLRVRDQVSHPYKTGKILYFSGYAVGRVKDSQLIANKHAPN